MEKSKKHFVPWFNSAEWFHVFNLIYGEQNDVSSLRKALKILKIWKCRSPNLQSGAEGTLIILGALTIDPKIDDFNKKLIYSSSILRFLNICAAYDKNQGTFFKTAKKRKIPDWIISLRHDIAHSQNLPHIEILENALKFSLEWLYKNYWQLVSATLSDFILTKNDQIIEFDQLKQEIEPFLTNYLYITVAKTANFGYEKIGDIKDKSIKKSIENELQAILSPFKIENKTKFSQILHLLWLKIEKKILSKNLNFKNFIVPELLIENEIFMRTSEEIQDIEKSELVFTFEKLLRNLHSSNMIEGLLEKLLDIIYDQKSVKDLKEMSAFWLRELGKSFNKCLIAQNLYENLSAEVKNNMSATQLNIKLKQDCERENPGLKHVATLDLMQNLPEIFENVEMFKEKVLREPNEFTSIFMPIFLEICDDFNNADVQDKILKLHDSFSNVSQDPIESPLDDKIYTLADLSKLQAMGLDRTENMIENEDQMDCDDSENKKILWEKVTDIGFENCPIGILPWQDATQNILLNCS